MAVDARTSASAMEAARAQLGDIVSAAGLLETYDIGPVLGKGGFASVRRGDRKSDRKPVALKVLDVKVMRNMLRDPRVGQQIKQVGVAGRRGDRIPGKAF
jgi:serine/threonine protein kinase